MTIKISACFSFPSRIPPPGPSLIHSLCPESASASRKQNRQQSLAFTENTYTFLEFQFVLFFLLPRLFKLFKSLQLSQLILSEYWSVMVSLLFFFRNRTHFSEFLNLEQIQISFCNMMKLRKSTSEGINGENDFQQCGENLSAVKQMKEANI